MTLQGAIQVVIEENGRPMRAKEIALIINQNGSFSRNDKLPIEGSQIYAHITNYPSTFQNINGYIVLFNDSSWKNILISYEYQTSALKGIFIRADVQFIIAVLLYYKRQVDINHRPGRNYPLTFDGSYKGSFGFDKWTDGGKSIINGFKSLEDFHIAPIGVFEECARLLEKLDKFKLQEIWYINQEMDTKFLGDQEFGNIYEYLLTIVSLDNIKSSLNHTPFSLRQLMAELLDPKEGSTVYDPVAGMGGVLAELLSYKNKKIDISGSEINKRVAQLGNMNLCAHGFGERLIKSGDCFEQIISPKQYDYIIGDLPANGITNSMEYYMLYNKYNLSVPKSGKSFGSLVLFTLSKLNPHGKAVLAISDGFLAKKGREQEIRKLLIEEDVIECIISLPNGTLRPYTDAKASLLILNRDKPTELKNRIQFIKATAIDQTAKSLILNNEEILQAYVEKESFSKNAQIVPVQDLGPEANLLADAYDPQFLLANSMLREGKAKQLIDLVVIRSGGNPEKSDIVKENGIPLVKVENLSKDVLDIHLDIRKCENIINESRYERKIVSLECILVARIGDSMKLTIFKPTVEIPRILPHSNVYAFIPNRGFELNIEYLYYQLHSTFIQEQINKRRLGAVMPYISISGLKETIVPQMSLDAQNEFVQSQKANLIAEERNKIEERIKALGYKEETKHAEADVIKTLTHQLRPVFLGLNGLTNRIGRIVKREDLDSLKEYDNIDKKNDPELESYIVKPENFSLSQLLEKLSSETKHLSEILTSVDKVMNFRLSEEDLEKIDILDFLVQYKSQKNVEQNRSYTIDVKGDSVSVMLHRHSFKELLDQLLLNAEKHAFVESGIHTSNKVLFTVRYNKKRDVVSIDYTNNGKQYELTQKDFTTAFEKGNKSNGSGIGGNYINRIVEAHKGKLNVEENPKKGFSLTIELPTSNNIVYE